MRYFLDHDRERPEWVIYVAAEQEANGTVVLTLPDSLPRQDAEHARRALASARRDGRREVAEAVTHHVQSLGGQWE